MTTFPALQPSSRTFTPGEYPNTPFKAWSGAEGRVRHSNVMLSSTLRLTFTGITEAQMLSILTHYQGQRGGFESFDLPNDVWVGLATVSDYSLTGYRWCYNGPPTVTDLPAGRHVVEMSLVTVPPEGATLKGLNAIVAWSFAPGVGDAPVNANGFDLTVTASLNPGTAMPAPNGLNGSITISIAPGSATGSGSGDPDFASVALLLHMDGSDGSTTFTDSSSNAFTVTANGDAQLSTAQSKFGGASGTFDGNDDVQVNDSLFAISGDWTFECWIRPTATSGYNCIFQNHSGGAENLRFYLKDGQLVLRLGSDHIDEHSVSTNTWQHVAMVRSSGVYHLYLDGVKSTGSYSSTATTDTYFRIGWDTYSTQGFKGWIDDVRITTVARYTAAFTPPTAAFPDS